MYFNGLCMIPSESWGARMELQHYERYLTFLNYLVDKRVLDCASGEGYGSDLLSQYAREVYGIDISKENVEYARNKYSHSKTNLKYSVGDCTKYLDFPDGYFDVVTSFETFEHVENAAGMLQQFRRVLSENGLLILSTPRPNINQETGKPYNKHHFKEYTEQKLAELISSSFSHFRILGQSESYPFSIHRDYYSRSDSFMVAIAGNCESEVSRIYKSQISKELILLREGLTSQVFNSLHFRPRPPRIIFVPLNESDLRNPSDIRRTRILKDTIRKLGAECCIMKKTEAVENYSDIIISQNRDFEFWVENGDRLKSEGRTLVFSFSDLLFPQTPSLAHDYQAFKDSADPRKNNRGVCPTPMARRFFENTVDILLCGSKSQLNNLKEIFLLEGRKSIISNDPIDTEIYKVGKVSRAINNSIRVYWEGYIDNVPYLMVLAHSLARLALDLTVTLVVVTSRHRRTPFMNTTDNLKLARAVLPASVRLEFFEWDPSKISAIMESCHIGIHPCFLGKDPFGDAKPANKSIIYNHCGLPAISSRTVANEEYIKPKFNGFLVGSDHDWYHPIVSLVRDGLLYNKMQKNSFESASIYADHTKMVRNLLQNILECTESRIVLV